MTTYSVVPATPDHVAMMRGRVRPADVVEIRDSVGWSPEEALAFGLEFSSQCWAGLADGVPICVFGVSPICLLDGHGAPWMVGTVDLPQHARPFLRHSARVVREMMRTWDRLTNWVDARNTVALRWLRWLGFEIHEPEPYGVQQLPFHKFDWVKE